MMESVFTPGEDRLLRALAAVGLVLALAVVALVLLR
jgi:hypothetical protein